MRSVDVARAATFVAAVAISACASTSAPPTFLPEPKEAETLARGGWVELSIDTPGGPRLASGELLAVTVDSVWIAARPDSASTSPGFVVARRAIREGKVTWYKADPSGIATASFLGTLSTISNGWLLILTAPTWVITGSIAGPAYTREPVVSLSPNNRRDLRPYARFPAGMPKGLDASFTRLGAARAP
jgi:hypothetical protein